MSFTHKITQEWSSSGRGISAQKSYAASQQKSLSEAVPDGSTDLLINFTLDVSAAKAIYIKSSQDVTLETNNGTTPDDTLSLKANVPYVWTSDSYFSNLLTTDVTALYLTNSSGASATLEIEALVDATP